MEPKDLDRRFDHHAPDQNRVEVHKVMRKKARELANTINDLVPEGREKSLAVTKLEELLFWANAGIARRDVEGK